MLRELWPEDAPALLELIGQEAAAGNLQGDPEALTLADMEGFILAALLTEGDLYRAVADEEGRFLGLIGLKDVSPERAEFRIALTREARGRGLARSAARDLLTLSFGESLTQRVYMYTRPDNAAANGFNRSMGFKAQAPEPDAPSHLREFNWYGLTRHEFLCR